MENKSINNILEEYQITDKHQAVYSFFGLCVYEAQCIETSLIELIALLYVIKNKADIKCIEKHYTKLEQLTLGSLIHDELKPLDEIFYLKYKKLLNKSLGLRNKIIHGYWFNNVYRFAPDKIDELIMELELLARELKNIDKELTDELMAYIEKSYPEFMEVFSKILNDNPYGCPPEK